MSKHDDRRITLDDVFMNQESLEQMIRDSILNRDEDATDEENEERIERIVSFAQQRRAERLRKWSKNENEK